MKKEGTDFAPNSLERKICNEIVSEFNCLYRSIAHLQYGDENRHGEVRQAHLDVVRLNLKGMSGVLNLA
jgi:hypothetical protein